jgi:hypothetical protein
MPPVYHYMTAVQDGESYNTAFKHSLARLSSLDPKKMAENSGCVFDPEEGTISLTSLGREISVQFPYGNVRFKKSGLVPVWEWRLLILNYLGRADNTLLTGEVITYRETDQGQVFYSAFYKSCIFPLVEKLAGEAPEKIKRACSDLGAVFEETSDITAVFSLFPRFPIMVKIWLKDEELPGSANILFDSTANHYLHTEDIAAAGELVSRFLIKQFESY